MLTRETLYIRNVIVKLNKCYCFLNDFAVFVGHWEVDYLDTFYS